MKPLASRNICQDNTCLGKDIVLFAPFRKCDVAAAPAIFQLARIAQIASLDGTVESRE
jgi:hypothetical protein